MEHLCDVILMTCFRCRNIHYVIKMALFDVLKFYCVIVNFLDHKWTKLRDFRSLRYKKDQNYLILYFF